MLRLSKQANDEIKRLEESRARNLRLEADKRREIENVNAIDFWQDTARHWHQRAKFLEGRLQSEHNTSVQAVTEMEIQSIERHHWKQCAEQNHGDVIAAEGRTDAMGDILDALSRGYKMEPFDGCAKWWRHDTDTLQAIAKAAREWEIEKDSKPLPDHACVPCFTNTGPCTDPAQCHVGAQQVEPTSGEVEAEELIGIANHMAGSLGGIPDEWQAWAIEIEQDIRRAATRVRKIPDQVNPIDDGEPAQQAETVTESKADGFNGHMIGTDGDRVGFIRLAENYGFAPDYNPENATSAQIEDDYSRAFSYMHNHGYPLKVAE